jgi:ankyrin repeat protein
VDDDEPFGLDGGDQARQLFSMHFAATTDVKEMGLHQNLHTRAERSTFLVQWCAFLLDQGVEVDCRDDIDFTPLHCAAMVGHIELCRMLLKRAADANARSEDLHTPLHVAAKEGYADICSLLIEHGANPDAKDALDETPLHLAASQNEAKVIQALVQWNAEIDERNANGETALLCAADHTSCEVLIHLGAAVDISDATGNTALHEVAWKGLTAMGKSLIDKGADVNARQHEHWTPLGIAAQEGHIRFCEMLLAHGAHIHSTTHQLITPLHAAAMNGREGVCMVLIFRGANASAKNIFHRTAADCARREGHYSLADHLRDSRGVRYYTRCTPPISFVSDKRHWEGKGCCCRWCKSGFKVNMPSLEWHRIGFNSGIGAGAGAGASTGAVVGAADALVDDRRRRLVWDDQSTADEEVLLMEMDKLWHISILQRRKQALVGLTLRSLVCFERPAVWQVQQQQQQRHRQFSFLASARHAYLTRDEPEQQEEQQRDQELPTRVRLPPDVLVHVMRFVFGDEQSTEHHLLSCISTARMPPKLAQDLRALQSQQRACQQQQSQQQQQQQQQQEGGEEEDARRRRVAETNRDTNPRSVSPTGTFLYLAGYLPSAQSGEGARASITEQQGRRKRRRTGPQSWREGTRRREEEEEGENEVEEERAGRLSLLSYSIVETVGRFAPPSTLVLRGRQRGAACATTRDVRRRAADAKRRLLPVMQQLLEATKVRAGGGAEGCQWLHNYCRFVCQRHNWDIPTAVLPEETSR